MRSLYNLFCDCQKVSTDTRNIAPGSIFFALRGASFDGNRFAGEALERGATYAVVDNPEVALDERYMVVDDTLTALQELAREHRRALAIPILAVAGSNGKTTTKELVSRVLATRFTLFATRGNLNNHIGVPLTLLSMDRSVEFGVVEMGASSCGEIARLCEIAEPNYGILTNIGRAHLEGFGGPEGIRRGKGELFDYLATHNGTAFYRAEDNTLQSMVSERKGLKSHPYSEERGANINHQLEGIYNRYNVAAAAAIGDFFAIEEAQINRAIGSYAPDNNRSQLTLTERNTLVVDCYNANPTSMQHAIAHLASRALGERKRRILILGDMRELGAWADEEHRQIVEQAAAIADAELWLVGELFGKAAEAVTATAKIRCFTQCDELCKALTDHPVSEALILIKGSHSIGLERTIAYL